MNRWRVTALASALAAGSVLIATTSAVGSPPEATGKPILDQFNPGTLSSTINGGSAAISGSRGSQQELPDSSHGSICLSTSVLCTGE